MRVITYRIILQEPALVTALEGDPNSGVAFDYLPGSALRGAIIGKYLRLTNQTTNQWNAADPDVRRLFFDASTRYLHGYRLDRLGKRSLPTPASWQHEKGNETDIRDFAVELPDADDKQWQGVNGPFCAFAAQQDESDDVPKVRLVSPDRHITVHTARTRRFGRAIPQNRLQPGDNPGAVYRYDALAEGQTFEAVILCDNDADAETLLPLLADEAFLGGSRSGGYGRARLEIVKEKAATNWREPDSTLIRDVDGKLIVTLLSDAMLRDVNGQFVVDAYVVMAALSDRLGVRLSPYKYPNESVPKRWAYVSGEIVGGFNRKWGLPLPQAMAVRMGSVFVFHNPNCPDSKLRELETSGIGERRAEGFGRVAVNWHTEPELSVDLTRPLPPPLNSLVPETDAEKLAQRMAERMLRQRLDERLVAKANANDITIVSPPSNAQLSRLRNIIHDELGNEAPNPQRVRDFVNGLRERNAARKQFERGRIDNTPALKWLDDTLQTTGESEWRQLLGLQSSDIRKVGGVQPNLGDSLRARYVLRLIDAVLARAIKDSRKEAR